MHANLAAILEDLRLRDLRDSSRVAAPLRICADSIVLDTTPLTIDDTVAFVLEKYRSISGGATSVR